MYKLELSNQDNTFFSSIILQTPTIIFRLSIQSDYSEMGLVSSYLGGLSIGLKIAAVGGAVVIALGVAYGAYRLYKYCTKDQQVFAGDELKLSQSQPLNVVNFQIVKWRPLVCSAEDLRRIKMLTKQLFQKKIDKYTCSITRLVTREPALAKCCNKFYEKAAIQSWLKKKQSCPNCRRIITIPDIIFDEEHDLLFERCDAINQLRQQIRKTLQTLTSISERNWWEQNVDLHMGVGYVENDL